MHICTVRDGGAADRLSSSLLLPLMLLLRVLCMFMHLCIRNMCKCIYRERYTYTCVYIYIYMYTQLQIHVYMHTHIDTVHDGGVADLLSLRSAGQLDGSQTSVQEMGRARCFTIINIIIYMSTVCIYIYYTYICMYAYMYIYI